MLIYRSYDGTKMKEIIGVTMPLKWQVNDDIGKKGWEISILSLPKKLQLSFLRVAVKKKLKQNFLKNLKQFFYKYEY